MEPATFRDEMDPRPRCEWCRRLVKAKPRGRPARFCSASCRRRAYERRKLVKEKEAEADAINPANFPVWAKHWHIKPKMPPHPRPRKLLCPVCKSRSPSRSADRFRRRATVGAPWRLHCTGLTGEAPTRPVTLLKKDIAAMSFQIPRTKQRRRGEMHHSTRQLLRRF
jgi:hypothetical protein